MCPSSWTMAAVRTSQSRSIEDEGQVAGVVHQQRAVRHARRVHRQQPVRPRSGLPARAEQLDLQDRLELGGLPASTIIGPRDKSASRAIEIQKYY